MWCAGCVTVPFRDDVRGSWRVTTSRHFRFAAALDVSDAQTAIAELEQDYAAIDAALGGLPASEEKISVLHVSASEMAWLSGTDQVRGFWEATPPGVLVLWGSPGSWRYQTTCRHELVHALSFRLFPVQPPWLAEGLAGYLENFAPGQQPNQIQVGVANPDRYRVQYHGTVEDALAGHLSADASLHELGWLLVHYLVNKRPDDFKRYLSALALERTPAQAWADVFGGEDLRKLNDAVMQYAAHGSYAAHVVTVPSADPSSTVALMSDGDWRWFKAQAWRSGALQLRPIEAVPFYRYALDVFPDDARSLRGLAVGLLLQGQPLEALPYAQRVVAAEPHDPEASHLRAIVLATLGRCAEAIESQREAVDLAGQTTAPQLKALRAELERVTKSCVAR
jgi:tetratricopeptide (TPR) repeat protein